MNGDKMKMSVSCKFPISERMHAHTNREGSVLSQWVSTEIKQEEHSLSPTEPQLQNQKKLRNSHLFHWSVSFYDFLGQTVTFVLGMCNTCEHSQTWVSPFPPPQLFQILKLIASSKSVIAANDWWLKARVF